jgi:hypothetical protein
MRGAAGGTRTPDPRFTKAVLYRLSYCGAATGVGETVWAGKTPKSSQR